MRFQGFAAALTVGAMALGGCAGDAPPVTQTAALPDSLPDTLPGSLSGSLSDSGAATLTIPPLADERGAPAAAAKSTNPPKFPGLPVPALDSLAGLGETKITALLGTPHFRRVDAPAELWQYRVNGCVLDLFLYPSGTGALAVDHLETRVLTAGGRKPEDRQACFAAMVRAARG